MAAIGLLRNVIAVLAALVVVALSSGSVFADTTVVLTNTAVEYSPVPRAAMVLQNVAAEYDRRVAAPMVLQNVAAEYGRSATTPMVFGNVAVEYDRRNAVPVVLTSVAVEYALAEGVNPEATITLADSEPLTAGEHTVTVVCNVPMASVTLKLVSDSGTEIFIPLENPSGDSVTFVGTIALDPCTGDGVAHFVFAGVSSDSIQSEMIAAGETVAVEASGIVFLEPEQAVTVDPGTVKQVVFPIKNVDNEAHECEVTFFGATGITVTALYPQYRMQIQPGDTVNVVVEVSGESLVEGVQGTFQLRLASYSVPLVTFATGAVYIGGPKPDLVINSVEITASPANPGVGQWFRISTTVRNNGAVAANNVTVQFRDETNNGAPIGGISTIPALGVGASTVVSLWWRYDISPSVRLYSVMADYSQTIDELHEGNNEGAVLVAIGDGGGLMGRIVVDASVSASVPANRALSVTGSAWYEIGAETYPVKGARVGTSIMGWLGYESRFENTLTDGTFKGFATHPINQIGYQIRVSVSDKTYNNSDLDNFTVTAPVADKPGTGGSGTSTPGNGTGGGLPGTQGDAWVESYGIFFNPPAPQRNQVVTVTAQINSSLAGDVGTIFRFKQAGVPWIVFGTPTASFVEPGVVTVSAQFTPLANTLFIIEVGCQPPYPQSLTNNDTATRALEVGGVVGPLNAYIDIPGNGQAVGGAVTVYGYATGGNFSNYVLDCQPLAGGSWTTITNGGSEVLGDVLGTWNTGGLPDGQYRLRLTVNGSGVPAIDEVMVWVYNSLTVRIIPIPPLAAPGDTVMLDVVSSHKLYTVEAATITDAAGVVYNLPVGKMYSDTRYTFESAMLPASVADGPATAYLRVVDEVGNVASDNVGFIIRNIAFAVTTRPVEPGTFNPAFTETAKLPYELSQAARVMINVKTAAGVTVATLLNNVVQGRGVHEAVWNGGGNPTGNYYFEVLVNALAGGSDNETRAVTISGFRQPVITNVQDNPDPYSGTGNCNISYYVYGDTVGNKNMPVTAMVNIYNFAGALIWNKNDNMKPGPGGLAGSVNWNGRDNGNQQMRGGIYRYVVSAIDDIGRVASSKEGIIVLTRTNTATLNVGGLSLWYDPASGPLTSVVHDLPEIATLEAVKDLGGYLESSIYTIEPDGRVFNPPYAPALMALTYASDKFGGMLGVTEFDVASDAWVNLSALYDERDSRMYLELNSLCEFTVLAVKIPDAQPPAISNYAAASEWLTPNSDLVNDTTDIRATITDNAVGMLPQTYLTIADQTGATVAELLSGQSQPQGELAMTWDPAGLPEGRYRISLAACDYTGNVSVPATATVGIDLTAPQLSIAAPASQTYAGDAVLTVAYAASDGLSGLGAMHAEIDGVVVHNGEAFNLSVLPLGTHTFTLLANDRAGNAAFATVTFTTVDNVPPAITIAPVQSPANQDVTLVYSVSDNRTPPELITVTGDASPYTVEGEYNVILTATDGAGNSATATTAFIIDKTAPVATLTVGAPSYGSYIGVATPLTLTAVDNLSAVTALHYRIDGVDWLDYGGAFTLAGEGTHNVGYYAVDAAGNVGAEQTQTLIVDIAPPEATLSLDLQSADGLLAVPEGEVTISATDAGVGVAGIEYRVGDGVWQIYSGPFELRTLGMTEGAVTLGCRAADRVGNVGTEQNRSVTLRPALTIDAGLLATPRVLAWWNVKQSPPRAVWQASLATAMETMALDYRVVESATAFVAALDGYNVYLIIGDSGTLDDVGDSLVAAQVAAGRTLLSFGYEDIATPTVTDKGWENIFGVKVAGALNGTSQLIVPTGALGGTGMATELIGKIERIREVSAGEIMGEVLLTAPGNSCGNGNGRGNNQGVTSETYPALVAGEWGAGKTLYIALPYEDNMTALAGLLRNAVAWSAPAAEIVVPGGSVGMLVTVRNAVLPLTLRVCVEAQVPAGGDVLAVYDNGEDRGSMVQWFDDLPAGDAHGYRWLLRLPGQPGPYVVHIEAAYLKGGNYRQSATTDLIVE